MNGVPSWVLILGVTAGVLIGIFLAIGALLCIRFQKKRAQIRITSSRRASTVPMRANGVDASSIQSDSTMDQESPKHNDFEEDRPSLWTEGTKRKHLVSVSGVPKYSYKDLQKGTSNFKTLIGQGAFGPVYKAQMATGETLAVKMLATNSKQGEKEFHTEVLLLGRLHHRNLVNLVGYCAEKGQHMLIYVYMANGSLASHLYSEKYQVLSWDLRVNIALDVARGLEYLHDGAVPPVIHRDIKSANILLDHSMRARVADFGLSREEMVSHQASNIRGTLGYLDPEYVSSRSFTKKSDVYSFGVLLFELIAARNPQQGLMEYVELAAMDADGKVGWEEIVDPRLDGVFHIAEVNDVAALAYKCINRLSRKRPSMRDAVQALSQILKTRHRKHHTRRSLPLTEEEDSVDMEASEHQSIVSEHHRDESIGSASDLPDV
ncbi:calcium/calmodulin-regulated receptor-like kinase 1 isoform X2 [Zingiber officinale]|uniref:calcium/calmodulin-regulated receptor-like kinase 1 isoform X2 n=1 Tax=Zingiber officinale TaxID=94328 RepID=UPI001C4C3CD6|nr:calcium/calmodulin-regulated receptor-like kinase 1 isoform X2 [Zingiber officinale]